METFSALLALCAGNSPVTGEFPSQRPVSRSFDVFFDLRLNKRLSKQSACWWFETPSRWLWRYCNAQTASTVSATPVTHPGYTNPTRKTHQSCMTLQRRHLRVMTSEITGNSTIFSTVRWENHQSTASLAHRWRVDAPYKESVIRKGYPCHDLHVLVYQMGLQTLATSDSNLIAQIEISNTFCWNSVLHTYKSVNHMSMVMAKDEDTFSRKR